MEYSKHFIFFWTFLVKPIVFCIAGKKKRLIRSIRSIVPQELVYKKTYPFGMIQLIQRIYGIYGLMSVRYKESLREKSCKSSQILQTWLRFWEILNRFIGFLSTEGTPFLTPRKAFFSVLSVLSVWDNHRNNFLEHGLSSNPYSLRRWGCSLYRGGLRCEGSHYYILKEDWGGHRRCHDQWVWQ